MKRNMYVAPFRKEVFIQCDQIVFQDLDIYNNENLPKRIQIVPNWVHNFAKYQINL